MRSVLALLLLISRSGSFIGENLWRFSTLPLPSSGKKIISLLLTETDVWDYAVLKKMRNKKKQTKMHLSCWVREDYTCVMNQYTCTQRYLHNDICRCCLLQVEELVGLVCFCPF